MAEKALFQLPADVHAALLRRLVGRTQADVAEELGVSAPVVNALVKGRYGARTDSLAERIRGQYMNATVHCPVWGVINARQCQDERAKPRTLSPLQMRVWRACQTCPHNPKRTGD